MSLGNFSDAARQCLVDLNVNIARKLWRVIFPSIPQPSSDGEVEATLHYARTMTRSIGFKYRAYSHAWLAERALPSGLPDRLRPRAERLYPRVVSAVGISVNFQTPELQPLVPIVRGAMEDAVREVHADGKILDTPLVKRRMAEARARVFKQLMLL